MVALVPSPFRLILPSEKHLRACLTATVAAVLISVFFPAAAFCADRNAAVRGVIDGDTVVIDGNERVRYIGIDTPETGEPFYKEARERNKALVYGKRVNVVICAREPRDGYGRLLAWVWVDGVSVNEALLKEGLARAMPIAPCGLVSARKYEQAERGAKEKRLGIWGRGGKKDMRPLKVYGAHEAARHIGEEASVRGMVTAVRSSKRAVFIRMGDFTAVIFSEDFKEFEKKGIDPLRLKGGVVTVSGRIRQYMGRPEIILRDPSRIRPG